MDFKKYSKDAFEKCGKDSIGARKLADELERTYGDGHMGTVMKKCISRM